MYISTKKKAEKKKKTEREMFTPWKDSHRHRKRNPTVKVLAFPEKSREQLSHG